MLCSSGSYMGGLDFPCFARNVLGGSSGVIAINGECSIIHLKYLLS